MMKTTRLNPGGDMYNLVICGKDLQWGETMLSSGEGWYLQEVDTIMLCLGEV